jgi:hypothetical protein
MKKGVSLFFLIVCIPCWSLDWALPVFSVRYEVAGGVSEDPDEEIALPSSLRNSVVFQIKESSDAASFDLAVQESAKDYFLQNGYYSYFRLEQGGSFDLGKQWKLAYDLSLKRMEYPLPDSEGLSKDSLAMNGGATVSFAPVKGTSLEAGLSARYSLADNAGDALQTYVMSAAVTTRLGEWLLAARYRGEVRGALGPLSTMAGNAYHTGSVSLQWDPNR